MLLSGTAAAHVTLTSPPPRTLANKAGPCGENGGKRGTNVTTFAPGAMITVEWDETVDHPGHYRIAFDSDGDDVFVNPKTPADNYAFTLMDAIPDKNGGHYTQQVKLPSEPCDNCTLQLMQIMTTQVPYNSFYYQCADITIAAGGDPGGGDPIEPASTGGGCATGTSSAGGGVLLLLAGLLARRARR